MNDQNEEKYRQKVREVLADGRLTDLEDTTLGFYQHTLKISDETAMRIFDEVLKEVTAKAGEQPNAIDESGSALKNDLLSQSQETGKQTTDKESAERITYQSWDEFEKAQYQKGALYKEFMPIAKQFHDMLISTFQEENKPVEARYGESTFSFSVPKDLTKSRKRTFASFGMLNLVTQKCYIQNLYKEADDELPEGSRLYKKSDPTVYVYSFGSMSDFECVKPDLKVCIIRSYELLSSESISRKLLKEESKILVNTSASVKCQNDANIDANDEDGKTALIRAAQEGDKKTVELLLDRGTDIEAKTNDGLTALICAASEGHTETVELLLDKGADIEAKSNDSRTALILAASEGYPETVGLLLDKGADIEADEEDGWRALHFAASEGHTETVGLLLDKGADIESKDSNGVTALIQAAGLGKKETVALLIEKGADIEATTNKGGTPLFVAVANGQMECVKMLIGTGANVNVKNKEGKTLLMRAEEQGHTEIVKYLKKATLGKDRKDSSGKTVTPSTAGMNTFDSEHIYGMAYVYFDVVMQNDEQSKDEFQAKVHVINEKLSEWAQDSNRITEIMQNCWKTYIHDINDDRETYEGKLEQYIFEMKDNMSEEQLSIVIADLFEIVDISANAHKAEISMIKGLAEIFGFSLEVDQRDTIIKNTKDCLTKDTDPPYPGQFCIPGTLYEDRFSYMPFPKVVGKSTKYKAEDLFRRFTSDEVSKIVSKIETENKIPYLVFIKGILDSKMNLPNKAPYWFMPFVIAGRTEGVMLYFDQDGFWYNSENPIVLKQCSPAEMIDSIEIKEGHFNDFVMELFKKDMPSLTVDEGIISTMRISGNDKGRAVEVDIAEMHGEGYGPQLEIMEAIWNIWKDVVEKSRGASSYMFDPAIFKAFNSWQEVIDWAYESEEKSPGEKKSKEPGKVKAEDDIDARDEDGKTALIRAAEEGDTETVEMLLDREADIEAKTNDGETALMLAAGQGHTETVELLLDKGADIEADIKTDYEDGGHRALHFAAKEGRTETVALLLSRGADIEAKTNDCWTPLMRAAWSGHKEAVGLLLDKGADIEAEDDSGWRALHYAAVGGHTETVELLLDRGADIEAEDDSGWRALHCAANNGQTGTVDLILDRGGDVEAKDNEGKTALILAASEGHTETVALLLEKGADIETEDYEGVNTLMWAERAESSEIVEYLTKYIAARSGKTAIKKEKSEATLNEHKSNSKEKVGKGDSEFLSPHSIPEYPGEFYFLTEKYSSKPVRIKHVYRLSRGEELFRKLSASEVDTIVKKISTMKIIPKLTFVREILEEKYKIPVKDVPFWFIPFVILAEQIGCFLYIERNGIYANYKESKEVDACFSWESATDVTYDRGFPELEDNSDDKPKLSFSFTSDTDEEYPDSEAMVSTLVLKTDDGHLTINEFHGDEFGSQLLIVKTIWDLWKKVVDQTRNSDVWPQNDEVPNGPQYRYFDSWDTLIAWAKDTSTDQSQNDTRVDEKRSDGNIKVFDQNIELYRRKVMDVLADGVVSDLERTGLDFFQHKLKLTDEDALRIFEEVLAEVLEKAGERAVKTRTDTTERAAVEESMSEETVEEETLRKMRITYSTWDEFEKGQGEDPLKKRFMPLARKVHELVIEALGEQNLPYEVRYGGGTFSFSVPKDLAKSGKRTYARFGLLDRTKNRTYFDSLYMAEGESLPEGSQFMSDGSSRCSYDLASIEEFENVKQDIKKGVVKSYRILAK